MEHAPEFSNGLKVESAEPKVEKAERIARAQETYQELLKYNDVPIDQEKYLELKELSNQLTEDLRHLNWHECTSNGLPWSPLMEVRKQNKSVAANEDGQPSYKAA